MFIGGDRLAQNSSKKDKQDDFLRAGIAGASYETVQRYGSAVKEHLVGFSGADNETGTRLQKSLKSIQAQGTNDDVVYEVLFWFRLAALSDYGERIIMNMDLSIFHNLSILFK